MLTIENLINQIQKEAQREEFPLDIPVYESAKKDPTKPILYFGNLKSNIVFLEEIWVKMKLWQDNL